MRSTLFLVLSSVVLLAQAQTCSHNIFKDLLIKLQKKEISMTDYISGYLACLKTGKPSAPLGFQPSIQCGLHAPVPRQAVAKMMRSGTLTLSDGSNLDYKLKGVISLQQLDQMRTRIYARFTGVKDFFQDSPFFSLHVHQKGEIDPTCLATGGHYNPCGKNHSNNPLAEERHVGDVARVNLTEGSDELVIDVTDPQVKLVGPLSVYGRAITVHAGASSARVGCATIAVTSWEEGDRHPDTHYDPKDPSDFWKLDF